MAANRGARPHDPVDATRRAWPTVVVGLVAVLLVVGAALLLVPSVDKRSARASPKSADAPVPAATADAAPGGPPTGIATSTEGGTTPVTHVGPLASPSSRATQTPKPLKSTAAPAHEVTAELARIESVTGQANVPGDIAGPALRVTVRVRNASHKVLQ